MPWKVTCAMMERGRFVEQAAGHEGSFSHLCRTFGISRKTGYKWLARHGVDPENGLRDLRGERVFESHYDDEVLDAIVALRLRRETWGAQKLLSYLRRHNADTKWPSVTTVKTLLGRRGLIRSRPLREPCPVVAPRALALRAMSHPNEVWCMDFKGWFRTADRKVCEPLTLLDGYSRFLLACRPVADRRCEATRQILKQMFAQHGRPEAIRSDNGAPFGSAGLASLTPLSVWLIEQGVYPEKIRPGHPEENARQERFHRTLKEETVRPAADNMIEQRARFDAFREDYNHQRPHGALGHDVPADHYVSGRCRVVRPYRPSGSVVLAWVDTKGYLRLPAGRIYLTESLSERQVEIEQNRHGRWSLSFQGYPLGEMEAHGVLE